MSEKLDAHLFELQQGVGRWLEEVGEFFGNEQFQLVAKLLFLFVCFGLLIFLIRDAIDERYRKREREREHADKEALIDFANSNGPHRT